MLKWQRIRRTSLLGCGHRRTIANMPEHLQTATAPATPTAGRSLLDVAATTLVADPAASLATVAGSAGISRTTLHKHFATRDDLVRAVAHRALDLWDVALTGVPADGDGDGGLHALVAAMIPIGPQLAFLWRNPSFDHDEDISRRWSSIEPRALGVLSRAQAAGVLDPATPDWWLLQTLYSLVYVAAESIVSGHLAPRAAPDLVVRTLLRGLGSEPRPSGPRPGADSSRARS